MLCFRAAWAGEDDRSSEKKIILIYTPPDHAHGTHMYEFECRLLAKCLEQTPGVRTEIHKVWPEDESTLDDAAAIVFYTNPAGDIVLAEERREKFLSLMRQGVGYVAIHWSTQYSRGQRATEYLEVLGGMFNFAFAAELGRPPLAVTKERLVQLDSSHPISRGWTEYDLRDEWYLAVRFHEDARPLLQVTVQPNPAQNRPEPIDLTVAWTFERPGPAGGRSFGTTLGHFHENFGIEAFRKMLVNGILWTAHLQIPATGAPVTLEDHDLILPPPPAQP